jgi:hypothetical protein
VELILTAINDAGRKTSDTIATALSVLESVYMLSDTFAAIVTSDFMSDMRILREKMFLCESALIAFRPSMWRKSMIFESCI